MKHFRNTRRGFIQLAVLILIGLVAVSYIGIDLEEVFTTPLLKKNLSFTWEKTKDIWTTYIYNPALKVFNKNDSSEDEIPIEELEETDTEAVDGS